MMIAYGPVPSRRLGRSLGINNIPPKHCTYACVYCQLERPSTLRLERQPFYEPERILEQVRAKMDEAGQQGEQIDYLTFVPDGEPTLDVNLGQEIKMLQPLGIATAVITNGSLLNRPQVREELGKADWVSIKLDTAAKSVWRRLNRPHGKLTLAEVIEGELAFAGDYDGVLATETMLVAGLNDSDASLTGVAEVLERIAPDVAYVSIPTRPPSEAWVRAPDEERINRAYQVISERVGRVETLIGYEGNAFTATGDVEEDLLSITAVHPMREDAVEALLRRADAAWDVVERLEDEDYLVRVDYSGKAFYLRRLNQHAPMEV
jgi:wyosine [tRNA(Phe)-imidazoG37] synthetase (radical SAM superfamily)